MTDLAVFLNSALLPDMVACPCDRPHCVLLDHDTLDGHHNRLQVDLHRRAIRCEMGIDISPRALRWGEVGTHCRTHTRPLAQASTSGFSHILHRPCPRSTTGRGMSG